MSVTLPIPDPAAPAALSVMEPEGDAAVAALAAAVRDVAGQLIRRVRHESGTALTWSQSALLSRLARQGRATASELAAENGLRTQTVWSSLINLEQRGLVTRERDATDRRNVNASLTDQGRAELAADRKTREDWIAGVLSQAFTSEERTVIAEAVPLLIRLADFDQPMSGPPAAR